MYIVYMTRGMPFRSVYSLAGPSDLRQANRHLACFRCPPESTIRVTLDLCHKKQTRIGSSRLCTLAPSSDVTQVRHHCLFGVIRPSEFGLHAELETISMNV